jgi:hypothetical protein
MRNQVRHQLVCAALLALTGVACRPADGGEQAVVATPDARPVTAAAGTPDAGEELDYFLEGVIPTLPATVTPGATATPAATILTLSTANPDLPPDVAGELAYFAGGGSGIPECWEIDGRPSLHMLTTTLRGVAGDGDTLIFGSLCELQPGETFAVTITDPTGAPVYRETLTAEDGSGFGIPPYANIAHQLVYPSPSGSYTITAAGAGQTLTAAVEAELLEAKSPIAIVYDDHVALHNLAADEHVRVFGYDDEAGRFLGWSEWRAGPRGEGRIVLADAPCVRFLGEVSGLVPILSDPCGQWQAEARPAYALVAVDAPVTAPNEAATTDGPIIAELPPGARVAYVGEYTVQLTEDALRAWYRVRLPDGTVGVMAGEALRPPMRLVVAGDEAAPLYAAASFARTADCLTPEVAGSAAPGEVLWPALWEVAPFYCVTSGQRYWRLADDRVILAEDVRSEE